MSMVHIRSPRRDFTALGGPPEDASYDPPKDVINKAKEGRHLGFADRQTISTAVRQLCTVAAQRGRAEAKEWAVMALLNGASEAHSFIKKDRPQSENEAPPGCPMATVGKRPESWRACWRRVRKPPRLCVTQRRRETSFRRR